MNYDLILEIIYSFYDKAKKDILIGYHFRVIDDFDEHIPRIADFWNLQINGEMKDKSHLPFNLLDVHKALRINKGEVFRWEKLFMDTLQEFKSKNKINDEDIQLWQKKIDIFKTKILTLI